MINEVIFDIETKTIFQGLSSFNPGDLGVSIVSLYSRQLDNNLNELKGEQLSFWEADFAKMWPHFSNADRIIGFNSLGFDVPALNPLCPFNFEKLYHFDILDQVKRLVGFRLSLDSLARETLGNGKIDTSTNAVLYWQEHTSKSLAKLKKYCEMDVLLTKNLYDYGLKQGYLKYKDKWNTPRTFKVDFSYPKDYLQKQMGLF